MIELRHRPIQVPNWRCTTCGAEFESRDTAVRHERLKHTDPVEERESMFGPIALLTSEEQGDFWLKEQAAAPCLLDWKGPGWYGPRPSDCVTDEECDVTYEPIADVLAGLARLVADLGAYEAEIRSIPKEIP